MCTISEVNNWFGTSNPLLFIPDEKKKWKIYTVFWVFFRLNMHILISHWTIPPNSYLTSWETAWQAAQGKAFLNFQISKHTEKNQVNRIGTTFKTE